MERFLARCPDCGAQALLDTANLRLLTPADPGRSARAVFTCPTCRARTAIPVGPEVVETLQACGVPVTHGHPSLGPPASRPDGPRFTHDDLLDLHLLLREPGWFDLLVATAGPDAPPASRGTVTPTAAGSG